VSSFTVWKRMTGYLRHYWKWVLTAALGAISSTLLAIAIPAILRGVIDIGLQSADSGYMLSAGLLVVGLGVLRGLAGFTFRYFGETFSHFIAYDIRNQVYNKVQNQSFTYHDESQTGTLITRAISDVSEMQRYFAYGMIDSMNTALLVLGVTVIMLLTSPILALLSLIPLIPLAYTSRSFAILVDPAWRKIMDRLQTLGNRIQETALGAEVVRAFAREPYEIQKFADDNEQLFYDQVALTNRWGTFIPLSNFIIAFSTAIVLLAGGLMERSGFSGVTVGIVVSFNAYILLMAGPIKNLGFTILLVSQGISSGRRVFEILDTPERITSKPDAQSIVGIQGVVRFNDVTFAHETSAVPSLKHVSLEARPGQVVALLGPTGSGKSTLVNLIPRFYDVIEGSVTIDDIDVRDLELRGLRRQIGFVLQQTLLFSASVRENIAYGRPEATEEAIIAAAQAADAHDFISEFPAGYDTLIGERGVTLSGGQRQRVAIARALLINPRILILDDSTSSVDTRTESRIREALSHLMAGRTTFIIAQRLNSVQSADQILVLKDGEIIERGTHDELLANNGYYTEIYELQLADQERVRQELASVGLLQVSRQNGYRQDDRRSTDEYRSMRDSARGD
jgi:ATP-binding cassette subfamily B multidrug efflux pump